MNAEPDRVGQPPPGDDARATDDAIAPISMLIVDDEPANLVVLETVLDEPDYRLVRANSADEALMALMREEFALLILDVRMPGMTGFELAQMIKERKKTASVPIIFLSAYYDKDQHIVEGYGSGAVDFLNKPVNPAILRSKVAVFADLHRKTRAITAANRALVAEIDERRRAQAQLTELNRTLEQRVAERTDALRQADQQLREMMGSISDGLLMFDRDWRVSYANEQSTRVLGLPASQLAGQCIWDISPPLFSEAAAYKYRHAAQTGQSTSFDEFVPGHPGRWLQWHCYPSAAGLSVYFLDITDRREVETRREAMLAAERAARTETERAARTKDEFLASLSHELRTPLAAIVGWVNMVRREDTPPDVLRRGIDVIARNAQSLAHLVSDLLDVNRIVSGKLRMTLKPLDLNTIAASSADSARPDAQAKTITLRTELAAGAAAVSADAARMHQVLANLVANAIKFTPAGGRITVATRVVGEHVEVEVRDTGQGIAPEFLPHLFERFSQADSSAARVHGGLGLGLSIVKNLVEMHGGSVEANSEGAGHGASFVIRLPRIADHLLTAQADAAEADSAAVSLSAAAADLSDETSLSGISLLLVDDHADVLEIERRLLTSLGATVTTANKASDALALLARHRYDVLLCDLGMPEMDGYALMREIRQRLGISAEQMPAAAVTAYVRAEDQELALQEGFQVVLQKPVLPNDLGGVILGLLSAPGRQPVPPPAVAAAPGSDAPRRLRTLFVEDNADLQEQIGWLLEEEGLDLAKCFTGEEALAEFQRGAFDLVITDVSLPAMSGVAFAQRVLERAPHTWLVFATGYPMGDRLSSFGPNVRALQKPFDQDDLSVLLREVRSKFVPH